MKKSFLILLLIAAMCIGMLSGCGSSSAAEAAPATPDSAETAAAEAAAAPAAAAVEAESATAPTEDSAAEAEAEPPVEITYPLEGNPEFSIAINPNGLIASIMGDEGFTMSASYDAFEEATGVTLDWNLYAEATWNEQFNLMIASNDWPDLFDCGLTSRYNGGVSAILADDVAVELGQYLDEFAPAYKALLDSNQGFADCVVQEDGTLVEFATAMSSYQDSGVMIRQDWLDELGLEAPSTIDELEEILKAFKSEYNLNMSLLVLSGLDTGLNFAYNVDSRGFSNSGMGWTVEDGVVSMTLATEGFKGYLAMLTDYYSKGYFNDDFVGISHEVGNVDSTILSGACGVFKSGLSMMSEAQKANASDPDFEVTALHDLKLNADDPDSGITEVSYTGINSISIATTCEDIENALMLCNWFYTDAGQRMCNWGVEGVTYELNDKGQPQYTEMVNSDAQCFMYMLTETKYTLQWAPTIFDAAITVSGYTDRQLEAAQMWTAERGSYMLIPKTATMNAEEQEEASRYESDVATYIWENIFKIVTNQQALDSYDDVLKTAGEMGLTRLVEIEQGVYDRSVGA